MERSSSLPQRPHPTALAFSNALIDHLNTPKHDQLSNPPKKGQTKALYQKSLLLGWRNRNSLSSSYPMTLQIPSVEKPMSYQYSFTMTQIHESASQFENKEYGTGAFLWPASIVLAKYLEHASGANQLLFHKTVLDLGAGTGMTSIACALLGASFVICTDGLESVVQLARNNSVRLTREFQSRWRQDKTLQTLFAKEDPLTIHVCQYEWENEEQTQWILQQFRNHSSISYPDIILVSDCVLPKLYPIAPLVQTLKDCMGKHTKAYLSYEDRFYEHYSAKDKFWQLAETNGLFVREIPREEHHEVYQAEDIEIWEVSLKNE